MTKNTLVVIVGPTAVGKTALSVQLAQELGCAVLNADSRQVFKELNIGTAKPTEAEMQGVRHYFVNDRSITEDFSAGIFEREALAVLQREFTQQPVCIMSGGSGLYIDAVCYGLDAFPKVDKALREQLTQRLEQEGARALYKELQQVDPDYAAMVEPTNSQRIVRGLEVYLASGQTYSSLRKGSSRQRDFELYFIGLEMPRDELYERINQRMDAMIAAGLFDEVRALLPYREKNALQTVGYQEVFLYLDGQIDKAEAIRLLKRNSRRYAKRQLTWFKRNEQIKWYHPQDFESIWADLQAYLQT